MLLGQRLVQLLETTQLRTFDCEALPVFPGGDVPLQRLELLPPREALSNSRVLPGSGLGSRESCDQA